MEIEKAREIMSSSLDDYLTDPVDTNRLLLLERLAQAGMGILELNAMLAARQEKERLETITKIYGGQT